MKDFARKESILMRTRSAFHVRRLISVVKSVTLKNVLNVKKASLLTMVIKVAQDVSIGKSMTQSVMNVSHVTLNFHSARDAILMKKENLNVEYVSLET